MRNESEEYIDYSVIIRSVERRWFYLPLGLAVGAVLSVVLMNFSAPRSVEVNLVIGKIYTGGLQQATDPIEDPRTLRERVIASTHPRVYAEHYGLTPEQMRRVNLHGRLTVSASRTPGVLNIHIHEKTYEDSTRIAQRIAEEVVTEHRKRFDQITLVVRKEQQTLQEGIRDIKASLQPMELYLKQVAPTKDQMSLEDVFIVERLHNKRLTLRDLRDKFWQNERILALSQSTRIIEERPTLIFVTYVVRALYGAVAGFGLSLLVVLWMGRADKVAGASTMSSSAPTDSVLEDRERRVS